VNCAHLRQLDGGRAYVVPTSFCLDCGVTIRPTATAPRLVEFPRVISYGGGLDSFAMLLGAIERGIRIDVCVFIDTGHPDDPSEWPSTYRHVNDVVRPLCAKHGIEFVQLDHTNYPLRAGTDGEARSLFAWLKARKQIPVGGPDRVCTVVAKVERFEAWMDARYPGREVEVWIGFDAVERSRAEKDPNAGEPRKATGLRLRSTTTGSKRQQRAAVLRNSFAWTRALAYAMSHASRLNHFPLIEWDLCRCRCETMVRESGHPVPRKSACVFCPYASRGDWQRFAVELPEQFAQVVELEASKPPTVENNLKLSIMDFRDGKASMLPDYIAKPYTRKIIPCVVCGAAQRATKATSCSYLDDNDNLN
jgi:hypothetical protein